jgi:hypothetical protein
VPSRRWTDQELADAVRASRNLNGVFAHLGLIVGGGSWVAMQDHILRLGLDTSHWDPRARQPGTSRPRAPLPAWTDDQLRQAYEGARSVSEVMRRLGLDPARKQGRRAVERRLDELGLERTGLPGQGWAQGTRPRRPRRPLGEILVAGSDYRSMRTLKRRLVEEGLLVARCAICGLTTWRGRPLVLHLDHVNGDRTDHRLANLRFLCPNCHSQTDTYCGRNIGGR